MRWGSLEPGDAGRLAELYAAVEAEDRTGELHGVDEAAERLAHPLIDLAEGTIAARDGDRIVAFGYLPVRQSAEGGKHYLRFSGGVHPAYRRQGFGRRIVDWAVRTAPGLSARAFPGAEAELHLLAHHDNHGLRALAERTGFAVARTFADMERRLPGELPPLRTPEGVRIATWTPELDDGARRVRDESFRDHWGYVAHTPESWRSQITGSVNFRPESSFLALAGDRAVGVLITHVFETQNARREERQAWIQIVGTLKEWRGKGVAGALMAHALAVLSRQGYHSAGLGVDVDNPTGAVGVYARAGFAIARRHITYALPVVQGEARDEAGAGVHE
ncbi:GNAT family N-acetyltransferase [Nonomuraea sp. NPDC048882]|uniref:GNAT family N-acetyltransferase n=1 Tax=Nonomuraea sp. NPDC048882 TaxID=3154347 RepID=UPI0033FAF77C